MEANRHNHITATYHLLHKKQQRNTYMRDTFGTHRRGDDKRLHSQGAPVQRTIDTKPRKIIEDELNQTMPVSLKTEKGKAADLGPGQPKTRDGHSEI